MKTFFRLLFGALVGAAAVVIVVVATTGGPKRTHYAPPPKPREFRLSPAQFAALRKNEPITVVGKLMPGLPLPDGRDGVQTIVRSTDHTHVYAVTWACMTNHDTCNTNNLAISATEAYTG